MKKFFYLLPFFLVFISACAPKDINPDLENIDQNLLSYLNPQTEHHLLIPKEKQKEMMNNYLKQYFSPWTNNKKNGIDTQKIKTSMKSLAAHFEKNPGWGQGYHRHAVSWIQHTERKMGLKNFPNQMVKGITVEQADLRLMPTNIPTFANFKAAGKGYPFDSFQSSRIPGNTPIFILHRSNNEVWSLIATHNTFGWVHSNYITEVDDKFINRWKTGSYVTPALLSVPLKLKKQFLFLARLGQILPIVPEKKESDQYTILAAQKNLKGQAIIKKVSIDKKFMYEVPIPATPYNIALLANEMTGEPYRLGGILGGRDSSGTMMDLFAPFGIWMPRNSTNQAKIWKHVSLENLKKQQKSKLIEEKGVPFLTTVSWPGHTMLYIGTHNGKIYTFHSVWGLRTTKFSGKPGRAVFGKTIVAPLDIGSNYINVRKTFLDQITTMTFLGKSKKEEKPPAFEQALVLF